MTDYETLKTLSNNFGRRSLNNDFTKDQIRDYLNLSYTDFERTFERLVSMNYLNSIDYDVVLPDGRLVGYKISEEGYDLIRLTEINYKKERMNQLKTTLALIFSGIATIISIFALFK